MTLPSRNDPCPCGSGLKFKKCCMNPSTGDKTEADGIAAIRTQAYKQMSDENWSDAIDLFKDLLKSNPEDWTANQAIASCYEGLEEYLTAAEFYEKALSVCPQEKRVALLYNLGVARACANRMEKAIEAFLESRELQPDEDGKRYIDRILADLEEIRTSKKDPRLFHVQIQLQRAFSDMEADRFPQAAKRLEWLISVDPENYAIFYNLGVVYTFLKRVDEAVASFRKAVDLKPEYAEAWYNMGQIFLLKKKDYSQALHCFGRATAIRPDYIGAHHQSGMAYELVGDRDKAVACWEKTLELDPGNAMAKDNIARIGKGRQTIRARKET